MALGTAADMRKCTGRFCNQVSQIYVYFEDSGK